MKSMERQEKSEPPILVPKAESSSSVVTVLENFLDTELTQDTPRQISALSSKEVLELRDQLLKFYESCSLPHATQYEARSYLSMFNMRDVGVRVDLFMLSKGQNRDQGYLTLEELCQRIRKYLLFFHSVCIRDPVSTLVFSFGRDYTVYSAAKKRSVRLFTDEEWPGVFRDCLSFLSYFLLDLKPLIIKQLVLLYPSPWNLYFIHKTSHLDELDFSDPSYFSLARRFFPENSIEINGKAVNSALMLSAAIDADYVPQSLYTLRMLQWKASKLKDGLEKSKFLQAQAYPVLEYVDLPALGTISNDEFVELHADDRLFGRWQTDLRRVLKTMALDGWDPDQPADQFLKTASETMRASRDDVVEQLKKTGFRRKLSDAAYGFGLGAVTGFVKSGDPMTVIGTAAISSSCAFLWSLFFRRANRHKKILTKFYSVLLDNEGHATDLPMV